MSTKMDVKVPDVEATPGEHDTTRVEIQAVQKRPLAPLFWSRIISLSFAIAFLVVAGSLGCVAFSKFHSAEESLAAALPAGTVVSINIGSLQPTNGLLIAACFLISFLMALYILQYAVRPRSLRCEFMGHAMTLAVCVLLLLAAVIADTVVWSTRTAQITAVALDGTPVPQTVVDEAAARAGVSKALFGYYYVRLSVVFAWIGWLLSLIACIAIFATHKSASKLLRARNEQRQKEADLNRSRSAGGGGRVDGGGGGDSDILKEEADEKGGLEKTLASYDKGKEKMMNGEESSDSEPSNGISTSTSKAEQVEEIMETTRVAVVDLNRHYSRN